MHGICNTIFATLELLQHEEAVLNTFRKTTFRATLIAATLAAFPLGANAAGLGRISVLSALGQPLRAEIELNATADELATMTAGVAPASAFKEASIPLAPVLGSVNMTVARRGKRAVVQLTSAQPVNDPFLDVLVELNWASGRLLREYTFLLDPPGMPAPAASTGVTTAPVSQAETPAPAARPTGGQARAQSTAQPAGGSTYRVRRGDTLGKIAAQYKPASVSMDQMLIALYRENPEAFIDDNINRLQAGVILNVPDAQQAGDIASREATQQVVAHAADFAAYRRRVATRVAQTAPKEAEAEQRSGGRITPLVEEPEQPSETSKDQVKISRIESTGSAAASDDGTAGRDASASRLQALEEDLVARDKALQEANERLAMLEKNISELQQLVEMKSENLAALQQQAAPAAPAGPQAPAPAEVAPVEPAGEKPADMAAPAPEAAETTASAAEQDALDKELKDLVGSAEETPATPEAPANASVAAAPEANVQPTPPVEAPAPVSERMPPAPVAEPNFLDELASNPNALYGGGAALVLLLGYGLYRNRKSRDGVSSVAATASDMPSEQNSVFGAAGGQSVDTGSSLIQTDFSQSGLSAIDADEGVDPVAEADVYMAYGRDAQAEEILLDATKADPSRTAIHLKLLEIYAQRKNLQQFETTATELYSVSGGKGEDWEKAVELGLKLDPDNPLFAKKPVAEDAPAKPAEAAAKASDASANAVVEATAESTDAKPATAPTKGGFTAPEGDGGTIVAGAVAAGAAAVAANNVAGKLDEKAAADAAKPAADVAVSKAVKPEAPADDSKDDKFNEPLDFSGAVPDADTPSPSQLKDTWAIPGGLTEFTDSDVDTSVAPEAPKPADDAAATSINAADLDFDLDETHDAKPDSAKETEKTAAAQVDAEGFDATDSALEFDLDLSDASGKSMAATRVNAANEESLAQTQVEAIDDINLSSTETDEGSGIDSTSALSDSAPADTTKESKNDRDNVATVDLEKTNFDSSLLDFDLELDDDDDGSVAGSMVDTSLDLSDISLDLDDADSGDKPSEQDSVDVPDLPSFEEPAVSAADTNGKATADAGSDDDVMDSLSKSVVTSLTDSRTLPDDVLDSATDEEVDTKLELARAYEEMGDAEGARELLDEVARDGNDAQKAQAKAIRDRLG